MYELEEFTMTVYVSAFDICSASMLQKFKDAYTQRIVAGKLKERFIVK